jgi:outer membrane protein assembly factor BamB
MTGRRSVQTQVSNRSQRFAADEPRQRRGAPAAIVACWASLLAALGPLTAVRADDWQTGVGKNSARYSLSTEVGPTDPNVLWQGSRPAIVAQQGVADGDLFVGPRIESFTIPTGTWIVAHDLYTGEERWAVQLPFNDPDDWRSRVSAIRDGQVYATRSGNTNASLLYALDPNDGSIIWESEDPIDESTTESLAFAANGDIIAGNFQSLMRINKDDGTTVWSVPRSSPTSGGSQVAVYGDRAYGWEASANGPVVSVFDLADGTELYSSDGIGGGYVQQLGLFVGPDGTVYAPRTQNNPVTDFFVAFEDTGTFLREKWRVPLGYVPFASFGVGPDGSVYSYDKTEVEGEYEMTVLRLNPDTGATLDTSPPLPSSLSASPRIGIDAFGKIFLTNGGFSNGMLFSFDADLTLRWSVPITNVNVGGPVIGRGGVLIVCGTGTNVIAYRTAPCLGDLDGDGDIDLADLTQLLAHYGMSGGAGFTQGDLDSDGDVDLTDLTVLLSVYGTACP